LPGLVTLSTACVLAKLEVLALVLQRVEVRQLDIVARLKVVERKL